MQFFPLSCFSAFLLALFNRTVSQLLSSSLCHSHPQGGFVNSKLTRPNWLFIPLHFFRESLRVFFLWLWEKCASENLSKSITYKVLGIKSIPGRKSAILKEGYRTKTDRLLSTVLVYLAMSSETFLILTTTLAQNSGTCKSKCVRLTML
jgi:hypothetical protein